MTTTATEAANAATRRFWEGFNSHNSDSWDEICTPDFINHDPALPIPDVDLATLKQFTTQILVGNLSRHTGKRTRTNR